MRDLDADTLLTHVTIHWLANTAGWAIRSTPNTHESLHPPAPPHCHSASTHEHRLVQLLRPRRALRRHDATDVPVGDIRLK
jgi:hypothetical protein